MRHRVGYDVLHTSDLWTTQRCYEILGAEAILAAFLRKRAARAPANPEEIAIPAVSTP